MKFRTVILKCKVNEIVHIRERLDEIAAVTEGKIWFETILQSESGTYAIICHYPDSNLDMFVDYIKNKNELHIKISKLEKVIEALTGRPADEMVRNYNICDNGFGVNYRRREKSILIELAELKKRLESAEKANYITPLRDMIDTCEEKIDEHTDNLDILEADLDDFKKRYFNDKQELQEQLDKDFDDVYAEFSGVKDRVNDIEFGYIKWSGEVSKFDERIEDLEKEVKLLWNNAFNGLEKRVDLFDKIREDHEKDLVADIQELFDDMEDRKKDISEQDRRLDWHHNRLMSLTERVDTLSKKCEELKVDTTYLKFKKKQHDNLTDVQNKNIEDNIQHIVNLEESRTRDWYELQQVRKDVTDLINSVDEDNKTINNTLTELNIRLKAIEKRLSIKPFYAPTEDEKDDD